MRLQLKFNPSLRRELAPGDRRLWLLRSVALRIEKHANPLWIFEVFHRRLLIALGGLAVAGYLLLATALYVWLERQPHNRVGWTDLVAPWRWADLRAKRGDGAVQAGLEALARQDYPDAYYLLRVGLARSPGNVEGRVTLARLYAAHEPERALLLLEEGLDHARGDESLIAALLEFYAVLQVRERALETVERELAAAPAGRVGFLLQRARISLLLQLDRPAEAAAALAVLPVPADATDAAGREVLHLELLLRTGRPDAVRARVAELLADAGTAPAVLRQTGEMAVALGDADLLESVLRRLRAQEPDRPGPYLFAIQSWHRLKRLTLREAAEMEYFSLFRADDGALQAVAALAVSLDLPDLVNRARQVAVASRLSPFAYQVHLTEIALRRGDTAGAMRTLRNWENALETLRPAQRFYPEFIRRLARAAFAGTPDQTTALLGHLAANRFQARFQIYELAAVVLEDAGHIAAAAQVARAGLLIFPHSAPLLTAGGRLTDRLAAATQAAAATPAVVEPALPATGALALEAVDRQLAADELTAARDLLRAVRSRPPAWLASVEGEFAAREVELAFLAFDALTGRSAARAYLDRHRDEADVMRLVALVRRLAGRERLADARLLQDEILAAPAVSAAVRLALQEAALPDDLADQIASEAAALAALDRHVAAADWAQAERLLRQLADNPPAWLAAATTQVQTREVVVRLGLDQRPLALAVLRELVNRGGVPRGAAFRLVRDLLGRGEQEQALLLAREIAKLMPGDAAAERLLREAEAPRPAE